ncbi:MAG: homoserine kinase [Chloroflexi bacterium]|nr:MAG: homoserine kinase [Chloroflexota bacterium]
MPSPALLASVEVPASSANLGSGFDCFAAALSLKLRAELFRGDEAGILLEAHGEGVPADHADPEQNLVIRAFRAGMRTAGGASIGSGAWRIEVASMIPAARGLGSSAAAIVAGLLLGATVGRRSPDPDELMALATDLEGHPDNVAAAIFGGIALAVTNRQAPATVRRFRVPESWIPVLFITKAESRTSDMRGVLPANVPFADAAAQAAQAALLATAVATGDASLLRLAMDDRLHQPYRLPRLPQSGQLIEVAYAHGASAACLSGAGPSVLALCDSPAVAHSVEKAMNAAGVPGMAARLRFDETGARITTP